MATALKYTESRIYKGYKVDVKVRLSDDCRNGHADFAITADIYEKNKYDYWKWAAGGCCHEEIADLKEDAKRKKQKIEQELSVHLYLLRLGMPIGNFIYYDHSNKGVFNWREYASRDEKVTQAQFDRFMKKVDYSKLPDGIEFQLKSA